MINEKPSFGVDNTKTVEPYVQPNKDGKINTNYRICAHSECRKHRSYNEARSRTAEYCELDATDRVVNVVPKECIGSISIKQPLSSMDAIAVNSLPTGSKREHIGAHSRIGNSDSRKQARVMRSLDQGSPSTSEIVLQDVLVKAEVDLPM